MSRPDAQCSKLALQGLDVTCCVIGNLLGFVTLPLGARQLLA
ncbi:hypothetical protein [Streptomyces sp. AC555_RSS877]|nr:hypothetical protein [Streptomyces sp. AC555_RSS877]